MSILDGISDRFDVDAGFKEFLRRQARHRLRDLLDKRVGAERLEELILTGQPIEAVMTEKERQEWRQGSPAFAKYTAGITDEEFVRWLPEWALRTVRRHGDNGSRWLAAQLAWQRGLLVPQDVPPQTESHDAPDDPGLPPVPPRRPAQFRRLG